MIEKIPNPRREGGIGRHMGDEVGASVRPTEEGGCLIVGTCSLLRGFECAKPHTDLLSGIFDFRDPSPRWPLPDSNKFVVVGGGGGSFGFEFGCFGWGEGGGIFWLEVEFHFGSGITDWGRGREGMRFLKRGKDSGGVVGFWLSCFSFWIFVVGPRVWLSFQRVFFGFFLINRLFK